MACTSMIKNKQTNECHINDFQYTLTDDIQSVILEKMTLKADM